MDFLLTIYLENGLECRNAFGTKPAVEDRLSGGRSGSQFGDEVFSFTSLVQFGVQNALI